MVAPHRPDLTGRGGLRGPAFEVAAGGAFVGLDDEHGDVEGAENVRRSVSDWLSFMGLEPGGNKAELDRYIGYWQPYATSHEALDRDADWAALAPSRVSA